MGKNITERRKIYPTLTEFRGARGAAVGDLKGLKNIGKELSASRYDRVVKVSLGAKRDSLA